MWTMIDRFIFQVPAIRASFTYVLVGLISARTLVGWRRFGLDPD